MRADVQRLFSQAALAGSRKFTIDRAGREVTPIVVLYLIVVS